MPESRGKRKTRQQLAAEVEELRHQVAGLQSRLAEEALQRHGPLAGHSRDIILPDTILSPEGEIGELELADIIDAPAIQSLMDDFYRLAHVPMSLIDLKGKVLVGVGWQEICTKFHRVHPETCKHCLESDTELSAGIPPGQCRLYKCKNNMWDIATPVMVAGQHVGYLFSGQFFFVDEPLDREVFRSQARRYGFDEQEYMAALEAVPRLARQTIDTGMAFFMKLAHLLSLQSYSNIQLARSSESLRQSREDLNHAQAVARTGSWRLDLHRNQLLWSDETYRIFGVAKGTLLTYEAFLATIHPQDREYVDQKWKAALSGQAYDVEHRILVAGEVKWVRERAELEFDEHRALLGGFGTVQDITQRKHAEQQLQELNATLEQRVAQRTAEAQQRARQLRALAAQLTQAEQRERQRLAEILHDHLQQLLVGTKFHLGILRGQRKDPDLRQSLDHIDSLLDQSLETSRSLTVDLSPPILHHGNMAEVLHWLADWFRSKHGLKVMVKADGQANPQSQEIRVLLFQSVRELLFNAVKHARVEEAAVELACLDDQRIQVVVRDDGVGFDPAMSQIDSRKGSGFGLFSIRERLDWLGGSLRIDSSPGHGTCATLVAPAQLAPAATTDPQ